MTQAEGARATELGDQEAFWYWIAEREAIRQKKESGGPWPWTDDNILQTYRFCNVFREHDRVTRWIDICWRQPYAYHPNLAFAMAVARQINWPPTLLEIGFPEQWDPDAVLGILEDRKAHREKIYTGAYMLTGTLGGSKVEQTVHKILSPLYDDHPTIDPTSLENTWRNYVGRPGFQGFMAYEVVTDLRHTRYLRDADDIMTWAYAGPGAVRGLNRYHGRPITYRLKAAQALEEMRALRAESNLWLPVEMPELEMRDIEHSLCEYDKYLRVRNGEGRPRSKYRPELTA